MNMVERVADAILAKTPPGYGMTNSEAMIYARAAIEAMREPTFEMCRAANDARIECVSPFWTETFDKAYRAMISTALQDSPPIIRVEGETQ